MALYANLFGPIDLEYPNGAHAAGLVVEIRYAATNLPAVLYTNKDKTTPAPNPFAADALGNIAFWAEPGEYKIVFGSGEFSVSLADHPNEPGSGGGGGGGSWRHTQGSAVTPWVMDHPLGYPPAGIIARESTGDFISFAVVENTADQTIISFGNPTSGYADLS